MKTQLIALTVALSLGAAGCATADRRHDGDDYNYGDRARVLKVKPVYDTVSVSTPETRCWNERVRHPGERHSSSYTPTIAGAIIGGVIGNRFGHKSGKDAMTVAGAVLGGSIGNDIGKRRGHDHGGYSTVEKRCETVDHYEQREELVGYRVKYRYNGKNYWTRTSQHPGDYIQVRVSVEPVVF